MSAITIDNELVHYEVLGRGRPVILIHGWLGSWRYWIPAMQHLSLSNKYRIYALDLWGFGDSQKNSAHYGLFSQVTLLQQFMEKLGIEKAAVVGHSFGAAIAIEFARRRPQAAPKMMLISAPLFSANAGALPVAPVSAPETIAVGPLPTAAASGTVLAAPASPAPAQTPLVPPNSARAGGLTLPQVLPAVRPETSNPSAAPASTGSAAQSASNPGALPVQTASGSVPASSPPADAHSSETLRRNPFQENPERLVQLQVAAAAAGIALSSAAPAKPADTPNSPAPAVHQRNPVADILANIKPRVLLERHVTRTDDTFEKLRDEVDKTDEAALSESARSFAGVNLALGLSQLPMAVLLLHGQADSFLPSPDDDVIAKISAQKATGAFVSLVVPDYRHFPMLEHPTQFNRLLIDFLDADLSDAQANVSLKETWRRQLR